MERRSYNRQTERARKREQMKPFVQTVIFVEELYQKEAGNLQGHEKAYLKNLSYELRNGRILPTDWGRKK